LSAISRGKTVIVIKPALQFMLLTHRTSKVRSFAVNPRRAMLLAMVTVSALCGGILSGGFHLGSTTEARRQLAEVAALRTQYRQQQAEIARARETARASLDALTLRLGRMQARLLSLDALGAQLVTQADLDATEFDFNKPPPVGGPQNASALSGTTVVDFLGMLDELNTTVEDREAKLTVLERLLMKRSLRKRITPSGQVAEYGLLSSKFGKRIDPFTGKWEQHKGIDIAGKEGADIMALGDGVVIWSGERPGYGNLVEIDHGRGYITRYGHNEKLLVKAGDTVRKGQTIALMGSTGRSTGTHVHIEVVQNGEQVDPAGYLNN
jgi:murein DD-endopeptidase MepM/ murein hydrolase activator NlpD